MKRLNSVLNNEHLNSIIKKPFDSAVFSTLSKKGAKINSKFEFALLLHIFKEYNVSLNLYIYFQQLHLEL